MDEDTLITLAIEKSQRARYRKLLKDDSKRAWVLGKLNHNPPLNTHRIEWFTKFLKAYRTLNVDPMTLVYILSYAKEIDGQTMTYQQAIENVPKFGWGTLIGISPSLAIYYGELGECAAIIKGG